MQTLVRSLATALFVLIAAMYSTAQIAGKPPIIIIPGITGSELVNTKTGEKAWFGVRRNKQDDLRLPMTFANPARDRDSLRPTDIIRKIDLPVLPDVEIYEKLLETLDQRGYHEAKWEQPESSDVYYVFPYDWRRDNVESAHILITRIAKAKRQLRRPDLKFDIIAHSMGGLIARYAIMYGLSDLPAGESTPKPNWQGARHIDKLMMFGTPNEGSFGALEALLKGYAVISHSKLPFVDDFRAEDVISSPAVYQLLPHGPSARFLNRDLRPIPVDLYDPGTWLKFHWGPISDPGFLSKLKDASKLSEKDPDIKPIELSADAPADDRLLAKTTYSQVLAFFTNALRRAKRFHQAIDVDAGRSPVKLYAFGGECSDTLAAVVVYRDEKDGKWVTMFDAKDIENAEGETIAKEEVKRAMFATGDGRVTKRSLIRGGKSNMVVGSSAATLFVPVKDSFFACCSHTRIFVEKPIQDSFLEALVGGDNTAN